MGIVEMKDATLSVECGRDNALAAQHCALAEASGQVVDVPHAIEERQDRGVLSQSRRRRMRSKGSRKASAVTVGGADRLASPNLLRITSPVLTSCAARRGRTRNV